MYYPPSDRRAVMLIEWLQGSLGLEIQRIEPASSDASFRRYFRVYHDDGCHVLMDAPPEKETTQPFVRIAGLLKSAGLHTPTIFQQNTEQGFLLLEDLGTDCLLDCLNSDNADTLYRGALDSLFKLQTRIQSGECDLPRYDQPLLLRELGIFHEWFLEKLLGIYLPASLRRELEDLVIESALQQPTVCVHRDYHSRNLMQTGLSEPGVIDFQDAVIGPITYDLVSLLRDCYVRWPAQRVAGWTQDYFQRLAAVGLIDVEFSQFQRWFDLMGLQRHLKAVGIFSRLHLRDDKPGYLADIPRTMSYITEISRQYPELARFAGFLEQQVLPVYQGYL